MEILKKAHKAAIRELSKIKNVKVFLGKKEVDSTFHRLGNGEFLVKIHYKHKENKSFAFNKIKMIDVTTGKPVKKRKLDFVCNLITDDEFSLDWLVTVECVEK